VTHPAISVSESAHPAVAAASVSGGLPFEETSGDPYNALVLLRDEFGNLAVLRCLDARLTADPGFQRAYPAEAAALAGLAEPRVAAARKYVASATGAVVAVIRRRLEGPTLAELLGRLPRGLDSQTAAMVVRDVLIALDALHGRGIAHRAVQPDRIVVAPDGTCVLVDAGLAPRPPADDPAAAPAADLAAIPHLYAACTGGELDGLRGVLHAALAAALTGALTGAPNPGRTGRTDNESADDSAEPTPAPTAGDLAAALDAAAADSFDTGWEELARARLAMAVRTHREPRLRVVELLPGGRGRVPLLRRPGRGIHAGARRDNRDLIEATAAVVRQSWNQLLGLWLKRRGAVRAARASHALRSPLNPAVGRYVAPLIAFLITFGLVILVLADARSHSTQAMNAPTQRSTSGVAQAGTGRAGTGTSTATAGATAAGTGTSRASTGQTTAMAAPSRVTDSVTSSATTVETLTITSFRYTGHGNQAQVVIDLRTSNTGTVAVTVAFAEPEGWFGLLGGSKTHKYTLSGETHYTVTSTLHIPHYCSYFGSVVVDVVQVTANVPPSHTVQASDSGELLTDEC
jgi:hypothetical protein